MAEPAEPTPDPDPVPVAVVDPPAPDPPEPFDQERAMALIVKLREEVKQEKQKGREASELKRKLTELETAQLTEQERVAKERDDLVAEKAKWDTERQETNLRLAVYGQQQALGIVDADLAVAVLDRSAVHWEDGQPTNITDVLETLLLAKPILKGVPQQAPAPNLNAGGGQASGPAPTLTTAELQTAQAMNLSAEEYARNKGVLTLAEFRAAEKAGAATTP